MSESDHPNGIILKRCPKTGRIIYPAVGLLAIVWFLVRVLPKPSRAAYPCQQVAAGLGAGFLAWLASVLAALSGFHLLRRYAGRVAAAAFVALIAVAVYSGLPQAQTTVQILTPREGPNHPMGQAHGAFPGRVTWAQDFAAATWDGQSGNWWEDRNVGSAQVERMLSRSLQSLTGAKNDRQAWDRLFRFHNKAAGRGDRGYRKGELLVVKLNCNADGGKGWDNRGYPTPQAVAALVKQLVEVAGVPGSAILLTDPSRAIGTAIYDHVRALPGPEYQQVRYEGQSGDPGPQRVRPVPDMNDPIWFDLPDGKRQALYLPKSYAEATYMINYGLMRPHRVFGVTLAGKNHFGSVYDPELKTFKPTVLHAFALWDYPTPNQHGQVHSHPALLGHRNTGGKTILYLLDGLYTSYDQSKPVVRWSTMGNRWFSSLLLSQDPVAIDSVAYDLITSEPNLTRGNPSFHGNVDSYLHEAALADAAPSKAKYDPEGDGTALGSLGVHEHWNDAAHKQYSRNLASGKGIELVTLHAAL